MLPSRRGLRRFLHRDYLLAYGAQLVSFAASAAINLIVPLQVGPAVYGGAVAVLSSSYTIFGAFAPGYSYATVRHLAGRRAPQIVNAPLLRWLLVPATAAGVLLAIVAGPVGLNLFHWSEAITAYAAALIPVLSGAFLLDSLFVAQDRNGISLAARVMIGLGFATLPWIFTKLSPHPTSVVLGVLLSHFVGLCFYGATMASSRAKQQSSDGRDDHLRPGPLYASGLHYSVISATSTLFSWGVLFIVSWSITREELANLKIALAIPTAVVALMPFPQMFIFAKLHAAAASMSSRHVPTGLWILPSAIGIGLLAALILLFLGPTAISMVYGPRFAAAAAYTGILAWMVIPQLVEQPLLAVLSTAHAVGTLTPLYLAGLILSLTVPVLATTLLGTYALAPGIVAGRFMSVVVPAALLLKPGRSSYPS